MKGQLPPHDIKAEEATVGSIILGGATSLKQINLLSNSDFYHEPLRIIHSVCADLLHRGQAIDELTIANELGRIDKLDKCGGVAYLTHLSGIVPSHLDIESYANIVHNLSISRQLIELGNKCANIGYTSNPDNGYSIQAVYDLITDFKKRNMPIKSLVSPKDASNMMFNLMDKYQEESHSLSWGYYELDNLTSGIYPSELIVIGARPSVGKTQLMLDIAENIALRNKVILFCSVEMSIEAIMERRVARELGIGILQLRSQGLSDDNRNKLVDIVGEYSERNIYYLSQGISAIDIMGEARKMKDNIGLDIIFIDYLQFLRDCWANDRENQNVRVGRAVKILKDIARELEIPVVVASQLNRSLEHRSQEERHPTLADLRDSGNIEQDADVVFLLDREKVWDGGILDDTTLCIKMAKNRQIGTAPEVKLKYDLKSRRYVSHPTTQFPTVEDKQGESLI